MKRRICTLLLALSALASFASGSIAESPAEPQYEDKFDVLDPAWGDPDDRTYVENGVMVLKPKMTYLRAILNEATLFDEIDLTIRVRQVGGDDDAWPVGPVFWAEDYDNYYFVGVTARGRFTVGRKMRGKCLTPVQYRDCEPLKKGLNEWNEVRVVTNGKKATFHINGTEFLTIQGQPPADGSMIGVEGDGADEVEVVYELDDLRVQ